jgi:hypothetical protein
MALEFHVGRTILTRGGRVRLNQLEEVDADEFAAAMLGKLERIELPKPGQWIRQGQKVLTFFRDGQKTEPAEDLLASLPDTNWAEVTGEFFLTA